MCGSGTLALDERDAANRMCGLAFEGSVDQLTYLMRTGIDPNAANFDGRTALHVGARAGHKSVVRALLAGGARFDSKDNWGCTAKDEAAKAGVLDHWGAEIWKTKPSLIPPPPQPAMVSTNRKDNSGRDAPTGRGVLPAVLERFMA